MQLCIILHCQTGWMVRYGRVCGTWIWSCQLPKKKVFLPSRVIAPLMGWAGARDGWLVGARATTAPQKLPIVLCSISLSCHAAFLSNVFVNIVKLICLDLWHVVPEPTTPAKPLNCISRLFNEQLSPPKMPRTANFLPISDPWMQI